MITTTAIRRRPLLLALAAAPFAATGQDFPNRPVKLLLGFAPGGSGDALARILFAEVSKRLGQQLLIENRPGAATKPGRDAARARRLRAGAGADQPRRSRFVPEVPGSAEAGLPDFDLDGGAAHRAGQRAVRVRPAAVRVSLP